MLPFYNYTPWFLKYSYPVNSAKEWPCTSKGPRELRRDQVIDMHRDLLCGVYLIGEMEGWSPGLNRPLSVQSRC